jgi:hypothetical protein
LQAQQEVRVRCLGLTGHHGPAIFLEAMRQVAFETMLVAVNAADRGAFLFRSFCLTMRGFPMMERLPSCDLPVLRASLFSLNMPTRPS